MDFFEEWTSKLYKYKDCNEKILSREFINLREFMFGTREDIILRKISELSNVELNDLYLSFFFCYDKEANINSLLEIIEGFKIK